MKKLYIILASLMLSLVLIGGGSLGIVIDSSFKQGEAVSTEEVKADAASGYWNNTSYFSSVSSLSGSGTSGSPYQISTAAQLAYLAYNITNGGTTYANKYIMLVNNIDISAHYWVPIATVWPIYFDGCGFVINGLTISITSTTTAANYSSNCLGFFGNLASNGGSCVVNDLYFSNVSITCNQDKYSYVGVLAGRIGATGMASEIYNVGISSGEIELSYSSSASAVNAGGICGYLAGSNSHIYNCFSNCDMDVTANSTRENIFGGLFGYVYDLGSTGLTINDCYVSSGMLTLQNLGSDSSACVGGLIGAVTGYSASSAKSAIKGCCYYSISESTSKLGIVLGASYAGGLVGEARYVDIISCFVHSTIFSFTKATTYRGAIVGYTNKNVYSSCWSNTAKGSNSVAINCCGTYSGSINGSKVYTISYTSPQPTTSDFYTSSTYLRRSSTSGQYYAWSIASKNPKSETNSLYTWIRDTTTDANFKVNKGGPVLSDSLVILSVDTSKCTGYLAQGDSTPSSSTTGYAIRGSLVKFSFSPKVTGSTKNGVYQSYRIGNITSSMLFASSSVSSPATVWVSGDDPTYLADSSGGLHTTVNIWQEYTIPSQTLTIKYYSSGYTNSTNIKITQGSTTISSSLAYSSSTTASATYTHAYSTTAVTITIATVNTSYTYYISVGSTPTTSSATNSTTYSWKPNSNTTINVYVRQRYTITYYRNNGTGTLPNSSSTTASSSTQYKVHGASATLGTNGMTRNGYSANGWSSNSTGSGTAYSDGASYSTDFNLNLYARWSIKTASLHVMIMYAPMGSTSYTNTCPSGLKVSLSYYNSSGVYTTTTLASESTYLVAQVWLDGAIGSVTPSDQYVYAGKSTTSSTTPSTGTSWYISQSSTTATLYIFINQRSPYGVSSSDNTIAIGEFPQSFNHITQAAAGTVKKTIERTSNSTPIHIVDVDGVTYARVQNTTSHMIIGRAATGALTRILPGYYAYFSYDPVVYNILNTSDFSGKKAGTTANAVLYSRQILWSGAMASLEESYEDLIGPSLDNLVWNFSCRGMITHLKDSGLPTDTSLYGTVFQSEAFSDGTNNKITKSANGFPLAYCPALLMPATQINQYCSDATAYFTPFAAFLYIIDNNLEIGVLDNILNKPGNYWTGSLSYTSSSGSVAPDYWNAVYVNEGGWFELGNMTDSRGWRVYTNVKVTVV